MVCCCIVNCTNRSGGSNECRFFRVPKVVTHQGPIVESKTAAQRAMWISRINRKNFEITDNTRVCGKHFVGGAPDSYMKDTSVDWAPSLDLGYKLVVNVAVAAEREERRNNRQQRRALADIQQNGPGIENFENVENNHAPVVNNGPTYAEVGCQTDLTMDDISALEDFKSSHSFTEDSLKDDDEKVKFYTGIPSFTLLVGLFYLVESKIETCSRTALSRFEEFIVVLMKLRLNLLQEDLGFRFGVNQSTISRICDRWIPVMAQCFCAFIVWPDRETLRKTMPECFISKFGRSVVGIIDCFEIFVNVPSDLEARAQTWSSYKHHNTVKVLVCITPQGTISYISACWGGRTSDDKIVKDSKDFLDHLLPGDVLLADRGFDINEVLAEYQAKVVIPAFCFKKQQLTGRDLEETTEIANVRIHIERMIGYMRRKFLILGGTLHPAFVRKSKKSTVARMDDIVTICAGLINLCPPIVPMDDV